MQTTSKSNFASTSASVLMINAQGIMLSVQVMTFSCHTAAYLGCKMRPYEAC